MVAEETHVAARIDACRHGERYLFSKQDLEGQLRLTCSSVAYLVSIGTRDRCVSDSEPSVTVVLDEIKADFEPHGGQAYFNVSINGRAYQVSVRPMRQGL